MSETAIRAEPVKLTRIPGGKLAKLLRIGLWFVAISMLVFALIVAATWQSGWRPVSGRSMQPSIASDINLLVIRIGTFVKINPDLEPSKDCLVLFNSPQDGDRDVKRIDKISEDGQMVWMHADNKGVTGQDSDGYGWVPKSDVLGVVVSTWHPSHIWSSRNRNLAQLRIEADPEQVLISPNKVYATVLLPDRYKVTEVRIYDLRNGKLVRTIGETTVYKWQDDNTLVIGSTDEHGFTHYSLVDVCTGETKTQPTSAGPAKAYKRKKSIIKGEDVVLLWEGQASPLKGAFFSGFKVQGHLGLVVPELRDEKYSLISRVKSKTKSNPADSEIFVEIDNGDTDHSYAQLWYFGYAPESLDRDGNCSSITTRPPLKASGEVHIKLFMVAKGGIPQMRKLLNINDPLFTPQLTTLAERPDTS